MDSNRIVGGIAAAEWKVLSNKEDSAVFFTQEQEGKPIILRVYSREMPAYEAVRQRPCAGLPRIYDCRWENGLFFVRERFIDGISLQEMIDGGEKMDVERALTLTARLCETLGKLHEIGFIHRDVKPEHVLMDAEGELFLIDLDAAMRIEPQKANDTRLLGTTGYAAPEQFGLTRSDVRTDVFAVGIFLNTLLTGQHPAVLRYQNGSAARVIQRCIEMNPMDRYQSMAELRAALARAKAEAVRGEVLAAEGYAPEHTAPNGGGKAGEISMISHGNAAGRGRKRWMQVAVLAVAVCAAGTLGMKYFPQSEGAEGLTDGHAAARGQTNEQAEASQYAENGELQLYLDYLGGPTFRYNSCAGSQCLPMLTEDNVPVESDWEVYADEQIGWITGWEEEWLGWRLDSRGAQPGAEGFVHAKKDGKTYAVRIVVTGYPISAYTKTPRFGNMADGYLAPSADANGDDTEFVRQTYDPQKRVTLYLAVSPSFENIVPNCGDDRVTIEKCGNQGDWPNDKVYKLTFYNPDGGDAVFQVTHAEGRLAFKFTEEE